MPLGKDAADIVLTPNYIEPGLAPSRNSHVTIMELSDLYSQRILEIAANQPIPGRLANADATIRKVSRICGSSIEIDLSVHDGRISGYGHAISACALGQTSAAIVAANVIGAPIGEFRALRDQMTAMLKADGPPPGGKWADLALLEPVRDYAPRHTSTLLVFDAVVEALDRIEAGQPVAAAN
ncbi:MAG: iron-sulfur cluster assembly scaffold protein [Devosia sp.]